MKPTSNSREILLLTTTSFSNRQLCELNLSDSFPNLAPAQQLEAACWNGLIDELLPEISDTSNGKIFLWQIETGNTYLRLSMGASQPVLENYYSLEPSVFLPTRSNN